MERNAKTRTKNADEMLGEKPIGESEYERMVNPIALRIGHIAILFNVLEDDLDNYLIDLLNFYVDEKARIAIAGDPFSKKAILFGELRAEEARIDSDAAGKKFKLPKDHRELNKRLNDANRIRNATVHGIWEDMDNEGFVRVGGKPKQGELKYTYLNMSLTWLEDQYHFMEKLDEDLRQLHADYRVQMKHEKLLLAKKWVNDSERG